MALISTLAVNLTARTSVFDRKVKKSGKSMRGLTSSIANTQRAMMRFAQIAMGAVAFGALVRIVKQTMDTIDAIAKLSDRIGESTENLIALGHAAAIAGSSQEIFVKSLEMMIRRIGEAKMGLGQMRYSLEPLGLTIDDLEKKSPAEMFELVAQRIMQMKKATDRAISANNIFGRQGAQLLNLMERLSKEGLAAVVKEAEKLGITFSRIDAAKVEAANDAMTRLRAVFTGIARTLVIELAPHIEGLANYLTDVGTAGEGMGAKITTAFEMMTKAVLYFEDRLVAAETLGKGLFAITPAGMAIDLARGRQPIISYLEDVAALKLPTEQVADFFDKIRVAATDAASGTSSAVKVLSEEFEKITVTVERSIEQLQFRLETFGLAPLEVQLKKLSNLGKALVGPELTLFNEQMKEAVSLTEKLTRLEEQRKTTEKLKSWAEAVGRAMQRGKEALKKSFEPKWMLPTPGEGREIDIRNISIKGLAMGGIDPVLSELQRQTEIAQNSDNKLEQIKRKESLG